MGPSKGMALNVTYAAWALIFEFILLGKEPGISKVFCGLLILTGAILTALDLQSKKEREHGISGN